MRAFFDARCSCGARVCWSGAVSDRPPCPRCRKHPDPVLSQREAEAIRLALERTQANCPHNRKGRRTDGAVVCVQCGAAIGVQESSDTTNPAAACAAKEQR